MTTDEVLVCPECGKEYRDVPGVPKGKRLGGHLSGKHGLSGDRYWEAMGKAWKALFESRQGKTS